MTHMITHIVGCYAFLFERDTEYFAGYSASRCACELALAIRLVKEKVLSSFDVELVHLLCNSSTLILLLASYGFVYRNSQPTQEGICIREYNYIVS